MASKEVGALSHHHHHHHHHHHLLFLLFFTLITNTLLTCCSSHAITPPDGSVRPLMRSEIRRRLGGFQVCAVCTCCGGPKRVCVASPCCYTINCNIPNRPFGVCSFTPKACNCLGCHL